MPQYPNRVSVAGAPNVAVLAISAATVLRTGRAVVGAVNVLSAGSANGAIYDAAATGTATAGRLIYSVPATAGFYTVNWPCASGVVVVPGATQVLSITLG